MSQIERKLQRSLYESPSAFACLRYAGIHPLFIPHERNPLEEGINAESNRHNYRAICRFYRLWPGPSMQCTVCVLLIPATSFRFSAGQISNVAETEE
jgi:hypothetical protein